MTFKPGFGTVYAGSDGRFYSSWQIRMKLRIGDWKPCLCDERGRRLVAFDDALLMLTPIDVERLPERVEVWVYADSPHPGRPKTRVVDTRPWCVEGRLPDDDRCYETR